MNFNEKLKMLRKENNLTQEELAEKLNVSRQAITKWEMGSGVPDIENLKAISILFNITIDELIKIEKDINIRNNEYYVEELEIVHTKNFDIDINNIYELNLLSSPDEKVRIEVVPTEHDNIKEKIKIKFDDLYNKLDISIVNKMKIKDIIVNLYLPQKYIDDIEINSKMKTLNISNLTLKELEYDGELKYLNVRNSSGNISLNTTKCDIEASYDKFDGKLEVNIINSTARIKIPINSKYKTILKGIKNEFINAISTDDSKNVIELNGANSRLMILDK